MSAKGFVCFENLRSNGKLFIYFILGGTGSTYQNQSTILAQNVLKICKNCDEVNKRLNLISKTPNIFLGCFSYNLYKLFGPPQFFVAIFSCVRDKQGCCNLKYIVGAESHPLKKCGWWLFCGNLLALANLFVAIFQQCHDTKWHFVLHDMAFIVRFDDIGCQNFIVFSFYTVFF